MYGVKCPCKWFEEVLKYVSTCEEGIIEIWWNKSDMTANQLECNGLDLIVITKSGRSGRL